MLRRIGVGIITLAALQSGSYAAPIESFENSADPVNWQAVSPTSQTHNATNPAAASTPVFSTSHVTEGAQSGEFIATWALPGVDAGNNPHVSGGTLRFWSIRYNAGSQGNMTGNSINSATGAIAADVYNNNPYPISMSVVMLDGSQLERGPFIEFPANSSGTYTWDLAATAPVGWVIGNGAFENASVQIKSIVLYTETEPTDGNSSFFIDNIRDANQQTDVTAPEPTILYSAKQGAAPGSVLVSWKANTESDLDGYNIYVASDANFGVPTINRLIFPTAPHSSVAASATSVELTGLPMDENIYVMVRAFDNATPVKNEAAAHTPLGVRLRSDGGAADDRVVLDYQRRQPGTAEFALEGYSHGIAYNARALHSLGRYFDSVTAEAIDDSAETLAVSSTGITIWSNLLDGNANASVALSDQSVAALTTFYNANGNLMISGAGLAEDLSLRGGAQQTFLSDVLKATILNPANGVSTINPTAPFAAMGTVTTLASNFTNISAMGTTSNETLEPIGTAIGVGQYEGSAVADAGVAHEGRVVHLGFAFEAAASSDSAASELARQNLLNDIIVYLTSTSDVDTWELY